MNICCPHCHSLKIISHNYGKKVGGAIGTAAGVASVVPRTVIAVEAGIMGSALLGPPGLVVGSLAGFILSGLIGGYVGNAAGTALGEVIDENILDNYECLSCNKKFNQPHHTKPVQPDAPNNWDLHGEED